MPELSNIQTFEKINRRDFKPILNRFSQVLKTLNLWDDNMEKSFSEFEWDLVNGFVYSDMPSVLSKLGIKIRPLIMGYTREIDSTFKDNWISCSLLIEAEKLRSFDTGEFFNQTYSLVKALTFGMHKMFKQTGIYFTDEAQDGHDFDGIRCNDHSKIWEFDYALIPLSLQYFYSIKPDTHDIRIHNGFIEAWHINRWKDKL